jgi:hypothetical protein
MLAGAACLRLAHCVSDGSEVELTWVILEADGNALDDEVHGRVIEGPRRRLAQLHLETGGGQRGLQIRGEPRVSAVAVVDEEARAFTLPTPRRRPVAARGRHGVRSNARGRDAAHAAVVEWCEANGHARTGVRWEVYDHWRDNPSTFETAVYWCWPT